MINFIDPELNLDQLKNKIDTSVFIDTTNLIEKTTLQALLIKEEENLFIKVMKKVWETAKWIFERIAQFCVDAWHALFAKNVNPSNLTQEKRPIKPAIKELSKTPHPQKEKIKMAVREVVLGDFAMFRDSKVEQDWYFPLSTLDAVREHLFKKGFENRIKIGIKKGQDISEEETSDWHYLTLDWSKFSKEEIMGLALQQLKKGEKIYFHCGAYGSKSPYHLEFAYEIRERLIADGYDVEEEQVIDDGNSGIYGEDMKGWVDGVYLSVTKKETAIKM
jgi:hypothetical protein